MKMNNFLCVWENKRLSFTNQSDQMSLSFCRRSEILLKRPPCTILGPVFVFHFLLLRDWSRCGVVHQCYPLMTRYYWSHGSASPQHRFEDLYYRIGIRIRFGYVVMCPHFFNWNDSIPESLARRLCIQYPINLFCAFWDILFITLILFNATLK